jgi:hypothetical protein
LFPQHAGYPPLTNTQLWLTPAASPVDVLGTMTVNGFVVSGVSPAAAAMIV